MHYSEVDFYSFCFVNQPAKMRMPKQTDLMLGAAVHRMYNANYEHDDTGNNISDLNYWLGQTTGIYWVWKNSNKDYVGTCTYRIFWNEEELNSINIDENTLIVPKAINVNTAAPPLTNDRYNLVTQYITCHGDLAISMLYATVNLENTKIKQHMLDDLKNSEFFHPYSMYITSKKVNDVICSVLFDTLLKIYFKYQHIFYLADKDKNGTYKRLLDYLAERILHLIYTNINYYIAGVKIHEVSIIDLPH